MISPHRIPSMIFSVETWYLFSQKSSRFLINWLSKILNLLVRYKFDILIEYILRVNPIQDGPFRCCSRMGGKAPLPKTLHISYNDEAWHSYTSPKEYPKSVWITWHTPWFLLTSAFFHWKSANFAMSRNTDIDCILIHNF